eukprot:TRINITY_DN776046_c0_g1_i1.p1 TRINITY_DN776046_c0_g1~~TRINITY_DN776046_c0_g1_i1.p1  ORF type:complete len:469 (-),score=152.50 TRINITY_DN776046_c0_g1_i1:253-1659(-)
MNLSTWRNLGKLGVQDEIFDLNERYAEDKHKNKLNLTVGAYRTEDSKPHIFKAVHNAERQMIEDPNHSKQYLPIKGDEVFAGLAQKLLFGHVKDSICSVQCVSGTAALRIAINFVKSNIDDNITVYLSNPSWANHLGIVKECEVPFKYFRYYDESTHGLDINGMLLDLEKATIGSLVLLQLCGHNPTGVDPTKEEWKLIAEVVKRRNLITLFDCAYQGFATGDLENDAFALRYFTEKKLFPIAVQSFSKNMGLYSDRVAAIHVVTGSDDERDIVLSHLVSIICFFYCNPPRHGAEVVRRILSSKDLKKEWLNELVQVVGRVKLMRKLLVERLESIFSWQVIEPQVEPQNQQIQEQGGTLSTNSIDVETENSGSDSLMIMASSPMPKIMTWNHILRQSGMFSFSGLTPTQSKMMVKKYHIYMPSNGRMSLSGLSTTTIDYCASAMKMVICGNCDTEFMDTLLEDTDPTS